MLSIPFVFVISIDHVFVLFFHSTFAMITGFVIQSVASFPSGLSLFENKCACCEQSETIDDILENLFLYFVTRSKKYRFTFATRVPWSCVSVTRLSLYCGYCFPPIFCGEHALCNTTGSLRCDQLFSLWAFLGACW